MKKNVLILIAALGMLFGCHTQKDAGQKPQHVVLIFHNAPAQTSIKYEDGSSVSSADKLTGLLQKTIAYVGEDNRYMDFTPWSEGYDTLTIPTHGGVAELIHRYQVWGGEKYLLMAGDTVLFTYDSLKFPQVRSLTDERNTVLYNLASSAEPYRHANGYRMADLDGGIFSLARRAEAEIRKGADQPWLKKYMKYYVPKDSADLWSAQYTERFRALRDSMHRAGTLPDIYYDYYRLWYSPDSSTFGMGNDSLMILPTYQHTAASLAHKILATVSPAAQYGGSGGGGFRSPDPGKAFDTIAARPYPSATKALMLKQILNVIKENANAEDYVKYTQQYISITGDSLVAAAFREELPSLKITDDLQLMDNKGDTTRFSDVLLRHKGSVVYVDYWASWCAPCRASMPAALKLREAYRGQKVVFLYLALNDKPEAWRKAVAECRTGYLGENYFITNSKSAKMLHELEVNEIPRYMIYDREGKLVLKRAPLPEDPQVKNTLNRYLAK